MAKTRVQKEVALNEITESLKKSKAVVFANFQGLKVKDSEALRKICREQNVGYMVSKKTVLKKALESTGSAIDTKSFEGGVSAIFGYSDEVAPAQLIAKFAKDHEVVKIFGGILEGQFIDAAKVTALSKLPSKQQLLGQLVGTLNAPVSGFVNVLAGNLRGLVTVLNAVKDKKPA
ncbi:MAG TPA: 50S ribosomal protein L10 [Candidatus Kapabacteria bacterium]|nr:50S ribosomal protein L10 [Candidatus Kapabacteria bacterium]